MSVLIEMILERRIILMIQGKRKLWWGHVPEEVRGAGIWCTHWGGLRRELAVKSW